MNALSPTKWTRRENPEISTLREALGAVAIAPALAYSLSRHDGGRWRLRRLDQLDGDDFDGRAAALAAMRCAVVRCSAYCLVVEGCTGSLDIQFLNWDDRAADRFGVRP
jgi:alkylhydroperoxidase family enzyme